MVKQNFLTKMLLLCALIVGSSSVWADNIVFDFQQSTNAYGWSGTPANSSDLTVDDTFTNGSVTFTYTAKGSGTTDLRWWSTGDGLRSYKGNKFKIATSSGTIESITIEGTCVLIESSSTGGTISNSHNWTKPEAGGVTEVEFECNQSSGAKTIKKVTVTIASSSSGTATTTSIDASGITNTDVYTSTTAGSLSATVTADGDAIEGATVTWSSSNTSVATIASDGTVTLVAEGKTTITASYAGVEDVYQPSSATYELTVTSSAPVVDYATLPFTWEGGSSSDFLALNGVTGNGLGGDYSSSNAPYLIKFDNTGDYIRIKTDSQPGKVTIGVKMIGGATSSKITVQGSSDGETFADVEELTISGAQNAVLTLETTNAFAATDRYVRLLFTKGSNVGVGPISIAKPTTDPEIYANDLNIAYNTTNGTIDYTIVNSVEGGVLTAALTAASDWLTVGEVSASSVAFTATENSGEARFATVRLTYTYNTSETVTKDVTVTQAKAPVPAEDGVFDFSYVDEIDYGTGLQPSTDDIKVAVAFTAGNVTLTPEPTVTNKSWRWYTDGTLRLYTDTKMTIAVPDGYVITKIDFVGTQNLNAVTASGGDYEAASDKKSATWTGCAQSVVFTRDSSNPFYTKVTVTYSLMPASATVNIPDSHYGTYCSEYALDFSGSGVDAYTAAYDETEGKVVLTKIADGIVPANTGVVLYSETTGEQEIPTTATTATISSGNEMVGVTAQTPVPWTEDGKYNYILQQGKFKKATGASLRANRAYLSTTYDVSTSGAPELDLAFGDETTGIQNIERTVNDNQYYTLDGRRVAEPTKGLYIVNGKKVVIK